MFDKDPAETVTRLQAKYPKEEMESHILKRWINWFRSKRGKK